MEINNNKKITKKGFQQFKAYNIKSQFFCNVGDYFDPMFKWNFLIL